MRLLVPHDDPCPTDRILADIAAAPVAEPFSASRLDFLSDLSRQLRRSARGIPQIEALAFWLRRAELLRLAEQFDGLGDDRVMLMPRGTVFHIPPANVDTIFVYSLALSMLTGNRNIVRLSQRAAPAAQPILTAMRGVLADHPDVAAGLRIISYGHDDDVTAALTAACDVRVVWGGDATIAAMRRFPIPVFATELAFADRFSLAAIRCDSYAAMPGEERDRLAGAFVNDTYWFDQLGCSSARVVVWVGADNSAELARDFHTRVAAAVAAKGYSSDTSSALAKMGQSFRSMIAGDVAAVHWYSNSQVVLDSPDFPAVRGEFCGGGLFYQCKVERLADLVGHVRRPDQTVAVAGFDRGELREFARSVLGRGIDRIVPFGQALQFSRYWDGYDLLQEFTRRVTVEVG